MNDLIKVPTKFDIMVLLRVNANPEPEYGGSNTVLSPGPVRIRISGSLDSAEALDMH
jgi:hypothetical protein